MPHYCYIIYSPSIDKFYVGQTSDFTNRLEMHNKGFSTFTAQTKDWILHLLIICENESIALKVEAHIKSMKSRKYFHDLSRYPEMVTKLLSKFSST
jgi:putative endonuclease